MLELDLTNIWGELSVRELTKMEDGLSLAHRQLFSGAGPGGDMTGWLKAPECLTGEELARIEAAAERIRKQSEVLVVIGVGGSYLGARAVIDMIKSPMYNLTSKSTADIFFIGNGLSTRAYDQLLTVIGDRDFSVNVVSKSGGTLEQAIGFRVFLRLLEMKYGREAARSRVFVTTGRTGALRRTAEAEGYVCFTVPDDVGGRYSVLTPVGLLPIACAGISIRQLLSGASEAMNLMARPVMENPAWQYAAARNLLYRAGKKIELLSCYEPNFHYMSEWWKQLFGESEGKGGKGIFPAAAELTADLHSMGQYIQDGERSLFETVVRFKPARRRLTMDKNSRVEDGFSYIEGMSLDYIEEQAFKGTLVAHVEGGVPNIVIRAGDADERGIGELIYFFQIACALSGYLLGVNPFDQPGVEAYKLNVQALLGKPGLEERRRRVEGII